MTTIAISDSWTPPSYARPDSFTERSVIVGAAPYELPGTVTLPRGPGPFPGAVLVHTSSRHDADETIGGVRFFKDLAWGLASAGVAVVRYEKRIKQYPHVSERAGFTVKEDTVEDAVWATRLLAAQPEVDAKRVILVGHGVGGMLGPRIAREHGGVAGLAMLAANSRPFDVVTFEQIEYLTNYIASGAAATQAEPSAPLSDKQQLHTTPAQLVILRKLVDQMRDPGLRPDEILNAGDLRIAGSFILDMRGYDPFAAARDIDAPILVAHAERDYQITSADLEGWRSGRAVRPDTAIRVYPGLNHMFVAGDGPSTPEEYLRPDHVAPLIVADLARFACAPGEAVAQG